MSIRAWIGIGLVVLFAFFSTASLLKNEYLIYFYNVKTTGMDQISSYENRFSGIKAFLPPYGVVSYINDAKDHNENRASWCLTQYSLSPLIVVDTSVNPYKVEPDLVIGNFHYSIPDTDEIRGLIPLRDFGNGVILFKRGKR